MGDTYAAWEVRLINGDIVLVVTKAYAMAKSIAEHHYGKENIKNLKLITARGIGYKAVELC